LAILKAGGAYVPLDPNYPSERLSYMLVNSGVDVLLTQENLLSSLPSHAAQVVCLDTDWEVIEPHSQKNLVTGVSAANLAYVIYTSGSTGQPKGVLICHYNVVNFLHSMSHLPGLTQKDTFNAVTTVSFDIAALELYLPLVVGAKVTVASREIATNADWLMSELFKSKTTVMQATPATWQMLLASGWSSNYHLKILCGGEALSAQLANQILKTGSELWNLYGPTEATIWSTLYQVEAKKEDALSSIGRPIANTQIYILDQHLNPVPIGVPGELYIGGDGLARGYLNHPELTAEKFISNPFVNSKSERLYKTGDLASYLSNGNIEFLGRIDNQVKIRGFRVELGEIETILSTYSQIQQTVVVATEDIPGNKSLVAYVVSESETLSTHQLREFLQQQLPTYMVPSTFVILDTLPLTSNGKIDRLALPKPSGHFSQQETLILSRNITELKLAQIWSELLNVNPIGVTNNFFELGGHSLLAIVLMSKIKQQFQRNLPLATLFQSPTIEQLAILLRSSTDSLPWSTLVPFKSDGNRPPLFCIHPAGGTVFCYQHLSYYLSSEQQFYGIQSVNVNPKNELHTSLEEMANHYIQELKYVQPHGPYFLSGWSLGGLIAFEMAQQLVHQGEQIAFLGILDSDPSPFSTNRELQPEDDAALLVDLLEEDLDLCLDELRQLAPDDRLIYVMEQAKQKNLVPKDFDLAQARHRLTIYKLESQARENYKPQYYSGSVVLFKASEKNKYLENYIDIEFFWNQLVEQVETYLVPGNHENMVEQPHVQILAQQIQKSLDQAQKYQLKTSNGKTT
ncbi:MAG: amino acid adenylation domain-containing protein, partial [Rhizonema sp. PD37]|nr:amino acid adenylation domain-containing protein [Rhizonema sp. PD37]